MHIAEIRKVASLADTAIDFAEMGQDVWEYQKTRDASLVKERPGENVTWFHVRRIPTSVYTRYVMEATSQIDRHKRAFQVGCTRIDNLVPADGSDPMAAWVPAGTFATSTGTISAFSEREIEKVPPVYIEEIGSVCDFLAYLPAGRKHCFRLPPSCLSALLENLTQFAEDVLKSARDSRSSELLIRHSPAPSETGSSGDAVTDANATASPIEQ